MSFTKGVFKVNDKQTSITNSIKNISLNEVQKLISTEQKLLFVSMNLGIYSEISKLYYILKNK